MNRFAEVAKPEVLLPEVVRILIASLSDVQMLTPCDGGRQRAGAELHHLLRETDFHPGPTHRTAGPALLEATAA